MTDFPRQHKTHWSTATAADVTKGGRLCRNNYSNYLNFSHICLKCLFRPQKWGFWRSLDQCSSRKWKGTWTPSAEGTRIEAPKALRRLTSGEGVSPSLVGKQIEEGSCAPSPEIFLIFLSDTGAFWCILGVCFNFSIRRVKQSRKAVLCANCQLVSCLTWRTYHPWYHTNKHYCLHAWTQEAS